MAITTYDGLIAGLGAGQSFLISKASIANQGAGGYTSLWRATGIPAQPAIPTATVSTVVNSVGGGAINNTMTVATGLTAYMGRLGICGSLSHMFFVCDRIVHNGGLVANTTALTTLNTYDLPTDRDLDLTNYSDIHYFYEIYTDIGVTGTTVTFGYDSPTSSAQTVVVAIGGASPLNRAGRMFEILPNTGHPIVRLKTARLTATTGTAGSWGIVGVQELGAGPMGQINIGVMYDFAQVGLRKVSSGAYMMAYIISSTTSSGTPNGMIKIITG